MPAAAVISETNTHQKFLLMGKDNNNAPSISFRRLEGKVAIVTGGARGIGEATVKQFVKHGAKVVIADVEDAQGKALADSLAPSTTFVHCDVSNEDDVCNMVDTAVSQFGRLDILFNNAGVLGSQTKSNKSILNFDPDEFDRIMSVNVKGMALGIKHAARVMMPRGGGCIISTSSVAGFMGGMGPHAYTASKHAIVGATAHAVTAVIGSGLLAVPWSVAQMGWIYGPLSLFGFAVITYITARLLCDCYRTPDPVKGQRNHSYMEVVRATLGKTEVFICAFAQYSLLWGTIVGYTITAATSMLSVKRTNCYHTKGPEADCQPSSNSFLLIFGAIHIVLSQLPSLEKVTFLSVIAATMSLCYSFVALYLCIAKFVSHPELRGNLTGVEIGTNGLTLSSKLWQSFQALGNIAFSYTYAQLLIEIEDTLKSPPAENKTMKRATLYSIALTTAFYVSLGCTGYLAFGNEAPGNVLTAFHEPFWLVDLANIGVVIHLTAAFQVFAQPIFACYEKWLAMRWPASPFIHNTYTIQLPGYKTLSFKFTLCRLLLRPLVVVITVLTAMMFPFFNAVLGLLGSIAFFPLTVYLPVRMHMKQVDLKKGGVKWFMLQGLCLIALLVSLISAVGSVADIIDRLKHTKIFSANL